MNLPAHQLHYLGHGTPDAENGDCFRTCVANLFGLDRDTVPHFLRKRKPGEGSDDQWWAEFHAWAGGMGLTPIQFAWPMASEGLAGLVVTSPLMLLTGPSPRGPYNHTVIGRVLNGAGDYQLVHDPNPLGGGLAGPPSDAISFVILPAPAWSKHEPYAAPAHAKG